MEGLVDDDLPPLLSDTEGSDGSDMPDLENSSSDSEDGGEPTGPAAAVQGGTHTAHQQQQHARHPHQRPMSEQQRRMEAGINRNSRLWQVPDAGDSLAHSLGASPFDDEHGGGGSGMSAPSGMPVLQILPTISTDGSMMLTASLSVSPAGMTSTRAAAASVPNPLRNPTRFGAGGGSSSAAGGQRTEPLFVDGQQSSRRNGPASAFHGLAMPFLMGDSMASPGMTPGQFSFPGPAAAGAAAGAAGMTRVPTSGSTLRFVPLNNPRLATPISAARSMPGVPPGGSGSSNASGAAAQAAGGSRRSVIAGSMPPGVAGTPRDSISFFEAMGMGYGVGSSSQASSDSDGPFPGSLGPFRSGPRLRARRTRMAWPQQSAASAAAVRAGRAALSAPGAPTYTFSSSTPPQAAAAPPAAAAAAAAATSPAGAAGEAAADVALAQAGGNSSSTSAGAPRGESSAASGEPAAAAGKPRVPRPQGRRWWHPWRILTSGWSLISSVILGALIRNSSSSSGDAGSTSGAATAAAALPSSSDLFPAAGSTCAGAAFSLGLAAPGPSSRPGASRDRSSRARGVHHSASRTDSMDFIPCNGWPDRQREADAQQQQQQQQPARTWTFPAVSPIAAAAAAATAAAPSTGGLSEAFSAVRQQQEQAVPAAQVSPAAAAPLSPASRRRSSRPQGKRQRHEEGDRDGSRPASTVEASPQAAAAPAAADGAGSSCMPALQSAGQAGSSATSPGVAGTAPSTQQLVATTARAVTAVAAAATAAAEEHDDSSDLPELLDTCPFADDTSSSAGSPPGLVAADIASDGGLAGSSGDNMAGRSGASSGPPSLASGSDVDGLSLPGRAEWPAAGPAAAAAVDEDDGPPELVSGSEQEESDDDDDQIGAWFSYNAEHLQRQQQQQQQRGAWEPAGLQAGQHSSGLRPGFLQGQALHEAHSSNSTGQQQPPVPPAAAAPSSFYSMSDSYYNRARSIAAAVVPPPARPAASASAAAPAAAADADDSGSEGSWETASDQDLEHAAAAGAAAPGASAAAAGRAGRAQTGSSNEEPDLDPITDDSCEDEDEDDYEDESDYEDDDEDEEEDEDEDEDCDCPMCVSMRLINDDVALQRFAASGVATRAMAAAAGSATQAFGRPRSNAFAIPTGGGSRTTTGAVDSLCGDTDAPSSAARHPTGIPLLPQRGGKKGASGAGAGASGQQQQLPKGSITADASKARVDGLAVLLSDAAFTQQLLAGLPVSVEPGHSSIQSALEMIRAKSYMPINTVASHMLSGAATVADVQRTDAHMQAQRLLRQWNS